MASSDGSIGQAPQLPTSASGVETRSSKRISRRRLTLLTITTCLNVLFWVSLFALVVTLYLIAVDPTETINVPTEILSLASSVVSIAYTVLHTIFSLKQRIWMHRKPQAATIKKTTYIAVRFAVILCVCWLFTAGWNLIIFARQPACLPERPGLEAWQAGTPCVIERIGIGLSILALVASCILFVMLAVIRRPFEAHLFRCQIRQSKGAIVTPSNSQQPSRNASITSDKRRGRASASTERSTPSNRSNADVVTLDLNSNSPPVSIHAPSPRRSIGLGIFTNQEQPPPLPSTFALQRPGSWRETPPPMFQPTVTRHLPPPRISSLVSSSGFVPMSVPAAYSASTLRAVYPPPSVPTSSLASRSHPHLPGTITQAPNFSYVNRHARSLVSLTRPHRLSTATPTSLVWSSRSGSTSGDDGRGSPASAGTVNNTNGVASIAATYAILNGGSVTPASSTSGNYKGKGKHIRHASAPDTTDGAASIPNYDRKALGWKPQLKNQGEPFESPMHGPSRRTSMDKTNILPDTKATVEMITFAKELDLRLSVGKGLPIRKTRSMSPLRQSDVPRGAPNIARATGATVSRMPRDPVIPKTTNGRHSLQTEVSFEELKNKPLPIRMSWDEVHERNKPLPYRMSFDEIKNKPLPRIAAL